MRGSLQNTRGEDVHRGLYDVGRSSRRAMHEGELAILRDAKGSQVSKKRREEYFGRDIEGDRGDVASAELTHHRPEMSGHAVQPATVSFGDVPLRRG